MDYLPQNDRGIKQLFQAKVDQDLWERANKARSEDNLTWKEIAEAALMSYLDARKQNSVK
jgi:hypothetical protein